MNKQQVETMIEDYKSQTESVTGQSIEDVRIVVAHNYVNKNLFTLDCPQCGCQQDAPTHGEHASCASCQLQIRRFGNALYIWNYDEPFGTTVDEEANRMKQHYTNLRDNNDASRHVSIWDHKWDGPSEDWTDEERRRIIYDMATRLAVRISADKQTTVDGDMFHTIDAIRIVASMDASFLEANRDRIMGHIK